MKLFLTGGTGFLGRNIYEKWDGSSYLYSRNQYIGTLSVHAPDYIIHCAAEIKKNEEMFDSNIALTYQILEEARKLPIKAMVYIGSSSEYGRKSHPMTEKDFLDPTTLYEATKGAGSLLCQAYAREVNDKAFWYSYGTVRFDDYSKPGLFNDLIGLETSCST